MNVETKKHPVFLGPIMLHFTKDGHALSRFALEILNANKKIRKSKQIGVDMESATYNGFKHHFPNLGRLL